MASVVVSLYCSWKRGSSLELMRAIDPQDASTDEELRVVRLGANTPSGTADETSQFLSILVDGWLSWPSHHSFNAELNEVDQVLLALRYRQ